MHLIDILGSRSRLRLLHELSRGERYVSQLMDAVNIDGKNCKYHLDILENAGVVSSRFKGRRKYYRLEKEIMLLISPPPKRRYQLQVTDIRH